MDLCTYSRSEILADSILPSCPLELSHAEAAFCPCRRRVNNVPVPDSRVLECTWPQRKTWNSRPIISPPAFREQWQRICHQKAETAAALKRLEKERAAEASKLRPASELQAPTPTPNTPNPNPETPS